jgi:hypothetical protein
MFYYIFDLDHTVIDSSHRQLTRADGSLDLAHWIENCSREKIFRDSLLPLADQMRDLIARGKNVVICTARVMSDADYDFLLANGLYTPWILSREEGERMADAALKYQALQDFAYRQGMSWARFARTSIILDDNESVLAMARMNGFRAYHPARWNRAA